MVRNWTCSSGLRCLAKGALIQSLRPCELGMVVYWYSGGRDKKCKVFLTLLTGLSVFLVFVVSLTKARVIWKISTEEMLSDCPVGKSVGIFSWLVIWEGPAHCGQDHPWKDAYGLYEQKGNWALACTSVPASSPYSAFSLWWTVIHHKMKQTHYSPSCFWSWCSLTTAVESKLGRLV